MQNLLWSVSDVQKLFKLSGKVKSRQTILNAEERGEIPKADRVLRGKTYVRQWSTSQLPEIGMKYGYLRNPDKQKII